jgi:hypothetical protein
MGDTAIKMPPGAALVNADAVRLLEEVLAKAKLGEFDSIGIVVAPSFTAATGPNMAGVYVALDLLKGRIATALAGPPQRIIPVRGN